MLDYFFYGYLLWTSTLNNSWSFISYGTFILVFIGIFVLSLVNYQELQKVNSVIESTKTELSNINTRNITVRKQKQLTDLSNFTPLRPYETYDINQSTLVETLDMLIDEATKTCRFSYSTYHDELTNQMYLVIDFIQATSSIIIHMEVFQESDMLFDKINELFGIIFCWSKTIYTWNFLSFPPSEFQHYPIFFSQSQLISQRNFICIQHAFRSWYNKTFKHDETCNQLVHFTDSDGPLCSCLHRPCKLPMDTWSLSMATMHTFYQNLQFTANPLYPCMALTKLAIVVEDGTNRQDIETSMRHCPMK